MSEIINNEPTEGQTPEPQAEAPAEQQAAPAAPAAPAPQADAPRPQRTDYRDRPRGGPGGGRRGSFYESKDRGDKESGGDQGPRLPRFKKKVCSFCQDKNLPIDYKRPDILERFVTDRGKILPRRVTGTCARHQRVIAREIKRARIIALLPFVEQ